MKRNWIPFFMLLGVIASQSLQASNNPFKKSKQYSFGPDVAWYQKGNLAVKSGQLRSSSDMLYFHLMIGKKQLKLRLSKNDPEGDLLNSRNLQNLTIKDVRIDGRRLGVFQWCLDNQQRYSRSLKQNAQVPDDICINTEGDFIIQLNKDVREQLQQAERLQFVLEPFSREVTVTFDMQGYDDLIKQINPPPVVVPVKKPEVSRRRPAPPVSVPKPKPVVKPVPPRVKKISNCYVRPPAEFQQLKAIVYPCEQKARKARAVADMAAKVLHEKQQRAQLEEKNRQQMEAKIRADMREKKRQLEWSRKQRDMWVKRCQRHWAKGVSPCFCKNYLDEAPAGVTDTCKK